MDFEAISPWMSCRVSHSGPQTDLALLYVWSFRCKYCLVLALREFSRFIMCPCNKVFTLLAEVCVYIGVHVYRPGPQPQLAPRHPPPRVLPGRLQSQKAHHRQPLLLARLAHRGLPPAPPRRTGLPPASGTVPRPHLRRALRLEADRRSTRDRKST